MADPVAWKAVEKGWAVFDRDGRQVGAIDDIAGDESADIWDGFGVKTHAHGHVKYVPAEAVSSMAVGEVRLSLTGTEIDALEDLHEEIEEQIIPEKSRWYQRLAWWTTGRNR